MQFLCMSSDSDRNLEIWRQACLPQDLATSLSAIAAVVVAATPVQALGVLKADPAVRRLEVLACGSVHGGFAPGARTNELPTPLWQRLTKWLKGDAIADTASDKWLTDALPEGFHGPLLAGVLHASNVAGAMLVMSCSTRQSLAIADRDVFRSLLEPLAVALDNDTRVHELRALREAAEADRQTLLSRLGRQDINEEVVGARTGLKHVMERVELVATSDLPVLILGETGTGKEVVSRAIHTRSKRADGPFIRVNCGAIPAELVDSQLFGHEKGSFTGASQQHQGWFERADRGTLFLDEIGELPLPAQVRLLRVLQDHHIERVGGRSAIHVDVRIVAATHRDLSAGRLRHNG